MLIWPGWPAFSMDDVKRADVAPLAEVEPSELGELCRAFVEEAVA